MTNKELAAHKNAADLSFGKAAALMLKGRYYLRPA